MFGRKKDDVGLLPKDILVDLESNPNRADEMLERILKEEKVAADFGVDTFFTGAGLTASAARAFGVSEMERALRQMELQQNDLIRRAEFERAAQMQNQIGGLRNGISQQGLGGLGGIFGNPRF